MEWEVSSSEPLVNPSGSEICLVGTINGGGATIIFLSPNLYRVSVRARNACGWSTWSRPNDVTVSSSSPLSIDVNSAQEKITLELTTNEDDYEVSIYTNRGVQVHQGKINGKLEVDTSKLTAGVYSVKIENSQTVVDRVIHIKKKVTW